jgi:hypothetical protein
MMRAWENRPDTWVVDEPLYAHYLTQVQVNHPGVDEVIASGDTDWRRVVSGLVGEIPRAASSTTRSTWPITTCHTCGGLGPELTNAFLIRHPAEMLVSPAAKMGPPALRDTGLPQQVEIFRLVRELWERHHQVLDAEDVLRDPRGTLQKFCAAVGVGFSERMLSWPAGPRETDGVWSKYWYDAVERSTGFEPYQPTLPRGAEVARAASRGMPASLRGARSVPSGFSLKGFTR